MSIYAKILQIEEPSLPWHQLKAAIAEVKRGQVTANFAQARFGLSAAERQQCIDLVNSGKTVEEIDDIMTLANGNPYLNWYADEAALKARLGVT